MCGLLNGLHARFVQPVSTIFFFLRRNNVDFQLVRVLLGGTSPTMLIPHKHDKRGLESGVDTLSHRLSLT